MEFGLCFACPCISLSHIFSAMCIYWPLFLRKRTFCRHGSSEVHRTWFVWWGHIYGNAKKVKTRNYLYCLYACRLINYTYIVISAKIMAGINDKKEQHIWISVQLILVLTAPFFICNNAIFCAVNLCWPNIFAVVLHIMINCSVLETQMENKSHFLYFLYIFVNNYGSGYWKLPKHRRGRGSLLAEFCSVWYAVCYNAFKKIKSGQSRLGIVDNITS